MRERSWVGRAAVAVAAAVVAIGLPGTASAGSHPPVATFQPTQLPEWADGAAMAYDRDTQQVVLYGGRPTAGCGCTGGGTWLLVGADFERALPDDGDALVGVHLISMPGRGLLRFGGTHLADGSPNAAIAQWTGSDWLTLHPAHVPPMRIGDAAAFDGAGRVIRYGGWDPVTGTTLRDTWYWSGLDWVALSPKTDAGPLRDAVAEFDYQTTQLVLFGGRDSTGALSNRTWVWTDTKWVAKKAAPALLTPRAGAAIAYDPRLGQLHLWGGQTQDGPAPVSSDQMWRWTGSSWLLEQEVGPVDADGPSMVFDWAHSRLVVLAPYRTPTDHGGALEQLGFLAAHTVTTLTSPDGPFVYTTVMSTVYLRTNTTGSNGPGLMVPGTVTFKVDGKPVPGCADLTVDDISQALCAYVPTTTGLHHAVATYTPPADPDWTGSYVGGRSNSLSVSVDPRP